jgi:hypothetical protein
VFPATASAEGRQLNGAPSSVEVQAPQHLRAEAQVLVSRTQELHVAISQDGGHTYQTLLRQEYNFSPPGTTFERETWAIPAEGVTHLRLVITPDKGGAPCHATLTTLALQ